MRVNPSTGDTSFLSIAGPNAQPTFLNAQRTPIKLPYTIESYMIGQPGEQVNGWHVRPVDREPSMHIIFLHGNGGNIYSEHGAMLPLVARGASVYLLDYRGYGRSEGRARRKNVIRDADAFVKDALIRVQGSGLPVVLYGQSLGGHTAAVLSGSLPPGISGVVIEGGFVSFKEMARYSGGLGGVGALLTAEGPSAINALAKYPGPLLVIHSPADAVVPFDQAERIIAAHPGPKELLKLAGPHASAPTLHPDPVMSAMRRMLR
jgi:pimeloyl-ACP methyl ester carboxylesterase